jgi:hypothetical protein
MQNFAGVNMTEENQEYQVEEVIPSPPKKKTKSIIPKILDTYTTQVFTNANINTCGICGDKKRTNKEGKVFCPHNNPECPMR